MVYDFVLDTGIIMLTSYISDFTQLMLINVLAYTCIIFRYDSRLEGSHEPVKELVLLIYLLAADFPQTVIQQTSLRTKTPWLTGVIS